MKEASKDSKHFLGTLAILERNSISEISIGATLAAVAESIKETLFAHSCNSITRLGIGGIDVAIALARLAKVA